MSQPTSPQPHHDSTLWALPFTQLEWELTPPAVRDYTKHQHRQIAQLQTQMAQFQSQIEQLQHQVETLQGRVAQTSQTSSKPPSSDSPFNKPKRQRKTSTSKRGGQKGHRGNGPTILSPTEVHLIEPGPCPCGAGNVISLSPYHTHQVIELPPIEMEIHHFVLQQGHCQGCGRQRKAQVPSPYQAGYGPRLSALIGELAGVHRTSWRLIQDFCHSVCNIPISLGAVQKVINRVSQAIVPHYEAIATLAHQAPVGYIDETPWYCQNALQWLWIMATDTVTYYRIDPHRSTEAFVALIDDWQGVLVSDGYGVYQDWVNQRQTCLAHLIRTARGLSQRRDPAIAACGNVALRELQRLCHMAHEPPTGGQWQAWYARFCRLLDRYQERADDAGRLARRLVREMTSLWVFLREHIVEPTNNRAERGLRFGVMWRKTSHGTDSEQGNRWVERSLSLRHTCRQMGQSTFGILVDAVTSLFQGHQPDLAWLY
jgi:transposase